MSSLGFIRSCASGAATFVTRHAVYSALTGLGVGCLAWAGYRALRDPITKGEEKYYLDQRRHFAVLRTGQDPTTYDSETVAREFRDIADTPVKYRSPRTKKFQADLRVRADRLQAGKADAKKECDVVARKVNDLCASGLLPILSAVFAATIILTATNYCLWKKKM